MSYRQERLKIDSPETSEDHNTCMMYCLMYHLNENPTLLTRQIVSFDASFDVSFDVSFNVSFNVSQTI